MLPIVVTLNLMWLSIVTGIISKNTVSLIDIELLFKVLRRVGFRGTRRRGTRG